MDTAPLPTRALRIDSRYRHRAQDVNKAPAPVKEEEQGPSSRDGEDSLLVREHKRRTVMGKAHRLFHRHPAQVTPNVVTVNVEVVATVDSAGNVLGQATATPPVATVPAAVVPSIAAPAAVVPSVPAVPPFPSDLHVPSVPAYPWPSGVPTVVATAAAVPDTTPASMPESTPVASLSSAGTFPTPSGFNSTSSILTSSASSSHNSTSTKSTKSPKPSSSSASSSASLSRSSSLSSTHSSITSSATSTSTSAQTTSNSIASSTAGGGAGGYADPAGTGAASPAPTTASASDTRSSPPLETPQVVGTVVGSLAGVAMILWLLLFLLKRHKRKQRGALQLTGDDHTDRDLAPTMTQDTARTSFVPPSFLNRFSGVSRSTVDSSGTGEKSFQRISGRKLPSAFSEGMTSEQFASGRGDNALSGSSFYHDEKGWYGGPGVMSKDFGDSSFAKEIGGTSNTGTMGTEARVRPSPAQTPVIRHADENPGWGAPPRNGGGTLSPPLTPNPDFPRGSLGRSHPSRDGSTISRSSRFTENV